MKKYEINPEHLEFLLKRANNKCEICNETFDNKIKPNIDHDPETGFIRGILCRRCNSGIGQFKDSTTRLKNAICYLDSAFYRILEKSDKCL